MQHWKPAHHTTVKPVFKTTWEVGTTWELRTATLAPRPTQDIEIELRNTTTSEFMTVFHSPLGVPNSQVPLYYATETSWLARLFWRCVYVHAGLCWYADRRFHSWKRVFLPRLESGFAWGVDAINSLFGVNTSSIIHDKLLVRYLF